MRLASLPVGDFVFFFKPSAGSNQFFLLVSDTFLLYFIKKIKGSCGIKLYYKLISYTHIPGVEIKNFKKNQKKITLIIKKLKVKKRKLC